MISLPEYHWFCDFVIFYWSPYYIVDKYDFCVWESVDGVISDPFLKSGPLFVFSSNENQEALLTAGMLENVWKTTPEKYDMSTTASQAPKTQDH